MHDRYGVLLCQETCKYAGGKAAPGVDVGSIVCHRDSSAGDMDGTGLPVRIKQQIVQPLVLKMVDIFPKCDGPLDVVHSHSVAAILLRNLLLCGRSTPAQQQNNEDDRGEFPENTVHEALLPVMQHHADTNKVPSKRRDPFKVDLRRTVDPICGIFPAYVFTFSLPQGPGTPHGWCPWPFRQ